MNTLLERLRGLSLSERHTGLLLLLLAAAHGFVVLLIGPKGAPDGYAYIGAAQALLDNGFDHSLGSQESHRFFILLLALLMAVAGDYWQQALLLLQWALYAVCYWLLIRRLRASGVSAWPLLAALGLLLISYESLQWALYTLTDAISLASVFMFAISLAALLERPGIVKLATATALLLIASVSRPIFAPMLGIALLAALLFLLERRNRSDRIHLLYPLLMAAMLTMGAALGLWLIYSPEVLPTALERLVLRIREISWETGIVLDDRPHTFIPPPQDYLGYAWLLLLRLGYFFALHVQGFSLSHTLFNVAFLGTAYLLGASALGESLRRDTVLSRPQARLLWLMFTVIAVFALFYSMILIDYDWRYRAPVVLPLVVCAAIGAEALWRRLIRR